MTHAPVSEKHVAASKRARDVAGQRTRFGAPVSRQQVADFQANVTKSQRAQLTKNRELVEALATGTTSMKEIREANEKLADLLRAVSGPEVYSKGWPVKSAVIATSLRK